MEFFTGARGSDIENAPRFLQFAFTADTVYPLFRFAAIRSFELHRSDEKFGEIARFGRFRNASLKPRKQIRSAAAVSCVQVRDDDDFKFQSLRFMNRHEL